MKPYIKRIQGKLFIVLALVAILSFVIVNKTYSSDEHPTEQTEHVVHAETAHQDEHDDGGHSGLDPLFFIILALIIGAATRHFLKKLPFPFTVLLLLIGLGLGVLARLGYLETWAIGSWHLDVSILANSLEWAAHIDPHLLLFVFLPILIFEAAFAMDVHTFKKSVANATLLAVPGIIIALFLTGILVYGIDYYGFGLSGWSNWGIALMFGSVVSATDPVAVVALLKELGTSKKLGTLIEGESLLNDGTAIVIFMVFFLSITGAASESSPIMDFFRIAVGGVVVGVIIGKITLAWVKKVINDALVEISVVIASAYLTFFIAEHFLHVSGVLALVALGIIIGGVGRTRISPQVEHFMHEFWDLAGFMANCLIFLIVGVVIAKRSVFSVNDFVVLGVLYIGVHVIRAIVILVLYPIMRRTGYGLSVKEAYVVWYGALRGAIGLALALIVAGVDDKYIPEDIRNQFLFLTAGIVTLSLLVNATTIKILVRKLGLTRVAPAKAKMILHANQYLIQSSENQLERIKSNRYLKRANWDKVSEYLPKASEIKEEELGEIQTIAEVRRRILEKEKSSYWYQFKDGLLGPIAVQKLSDAIDVLLDAGGTVSLAERKDLDQQWESPKLLASLQSVPLLGVFAEKALLGRLTISYDCAVGFVVAQEEALKLVESMHRGGESEKDLDIIEEEINENRIEGQTFIRNLRKNHPDIFRAISTRQAIRSILNYERKTVERLQKKGRIDSGESGRMLASLQERSKRLIDSPPEIERQKKG